jgi:LPXTG-site transpeptidase (sortase) family protein
MREYPYRAAKSGFQRVSSLVALSLVVAGGLLVAFSVWGLWSSAPPAPQPSDGSVASTLTGFTIARAATPTAEPTAQPAVEPTPLPPAPDVSRIVAPSVEIDAIVTVLGVDANGAMQSPTAPDIVAMYDFSPKPGEGGNTVFAGHVDYAGYGPAVFWRLRELKANDEIQVVRVDGTTVSYRVVSLHSYPFADAPVDEIVGPTDEESLTLITCNGVFDRGTRQYSERLVVRAVRSDAGEVTSAQSY